MISATGRMPAIATGANAALGAFTSSSANGGAPYPGPATDGTPPYTSYRIAVDGVEALAFLRRQGKHATVPTPDLILLDLNLPKIDGLEVLRRMRSDYRTKLIPVAIFTSSLEEQDLINGYSLGANSYVRKPIQFSQFSKVVAQLVTYWTTLNEAPPPGEKIWAHHFDRPA